MKKKNNEGFDSDNLSIKSLTEIQKRIIELKQEITGKEKEIHKRVICSQPHLDLLVEKENEPLKAELDQLESQKQFLIQTKTLTSTKVLIVVAVVTLIINVYVFKENVSINNSLSRPYIEIDTSRIKELDISKVNPEEVMERIEKDLPVPYINYLDFSIKNIGKLPARYLIDVSEFKEYGLIEIIPQTNDKGFIFPDQTIPISYYIKGEIGGENESEALKREVGRKEKLLTGDYTDASRIKVLYGYFGDNEKDFKFETMVEERLIEKGGDLPSERIGGTLTGYSREWFVIDAK